MITTREELIQIYTGLEEIYGKILDIIQRVDDSKAFIGLKDDLYSIEDLKNIYRALVRSLESMKLYDSKDNEYEIALMHDIFIDEVNKELPKLEVTEVDDYKPALFLVQHEDSGHRELVYITMLSKWFKDNKDKRWKLYRLPFIKYIRVCNYGSNDLQKVREAFFKDYHDFDNKELKFFTPTKVGDIIEGWYAVILEYPIFDCEDDEVYFTGYKESRGFHYFHENANDPLLKANIKVASLADRSFRAKF